MPVFDGFPHQLLIGEWAVHFGRIQEGTAQFQKLPGKNSGIIS